MKTTIRKNYSVEIPGKRPVVIRQTTTLQHAVKHCAYASQLQITVRVRDNRTDVIVLELPPIDTAHAEKPRNKRDKTYRRMAKKAKR